MYLLVGVIYFLLYPYLCHLCNFTFYCGFTKTCAISVWRPHILIIVLSGPKCFCSCDSLLIAYVVDTAMAVLHCEAFSEKNHFSFSK